jgi:hypothetical protein
VSATAVADRVDSPISFWGVWMFGTTLLVAGSVFTSLRIEIGGLQVHPNLVPLSVAFVLSLARISSIPGRLLGALASFAAIYAVSTLAEGFEAGEVAKLSTACVMIVAAAVIPRRQVDVTAGVVGMVLAVAIISIRGLAGMAEETIGANPLEEIANKNGFSVYALPALLLGGFYFLEMETSRLTKFVIAIASTITVATVFSTGNRSGWAGVFLIALMLGMGGAARLGNFRGAIALLLIAAMSYTAFREWGSSAVVEYRMGQTMSGYQSDNYRWDLFRHCVEIGLENPILGVSPRGLSWELARRTMSDSGAVDPHNVVGHIFGGCGFLTLFAMLWAGRCLWTPFPGTSNVPTRAGALLRMFIVLWLMRGMFTREVLYSPTFCIGMGLALAAIIQARARTLAPQGAALSFRGVAAAA